MSGMAEPRWLNDQEMRTWLAFLEASHLVERRVEQQLRDRAGMSHPQYEILVRLADAPDGSIRMSELAELLVTSKSGLTYQVAQLEKAGLVRRYRCPTDDRGVNAAITEDGRDKLREIAPDHVAVVRAALVDLLDADQQRAVADSLTTVVRALRAQPTG
ncbi:MarR family winged helix-turn-helix transcriptional regulator [Saccharomonospora sp. NB11]|jgi:DNA-binding MarR family transcriptional regulator|uniref:MarR family winged helix-turn-helix transcriptional regulator n=1 Tax=Saccharomonospora sp. NB11 TaxID=1642298 RepID=UPI0018D0F802|nr:MarR family transcriptional regulator [Saccharomonospora sp. NB11]